MSHIKDYTLDKKYKITVRFTDGSEDLVMSYDTVLIAEYCARALSKNKELVEVAWVSTT